MDNKYAVSVEKLASTGDSLIFLNSGKEHAAIVMTNIFKYSSSTVKIFAGDFNGSVCGDLGYQKEFKNFVERKGKVQIVLEKFDDKTINSKMLSLLKFLHFFNEDLIDIRTIPNGTKPPYSSHFTIGDNRSFRLEYDTQKYSAKCSFNNEKITSILSSDFDLLFKDSEKVNLLS